MNEQIRNICYPAYFCMALFGWLTIEATQKQQAVTRKRAFPAPQAAPETGHHTVSDELRDEALSHFFSAPCTCTPTSGGVNNVVNYVNTADGHQYILRVRAWIAAQLHEAYSCQDWLEEKVS